MKKEKKIELFEATLELMNAVEEFQSIYEGLHVSDTIKVDNFWNFLDDLSCELEEAMIDQACQDKLTEDISKNGGSSDV